MDDYAGLEPVSPSSKALFMLRAAPARDRRWRSDIVDASPIWLKSLSHYRNRKHRFSVMAADRRKAFIRNIAEVPWLEFPNHFGGALSKPLVMPDTAGSHHIDYRISMYQPKAYVETHSHKVQEQVYHVIEGEGLMHIDGKDHVMRKHDYVFLPPGIVHAISNTGLTDLVFLVVTSPVSDTDKTMPIRNS
jgi:quercetin dioxygenase-like cupin family protein